MVKTIIAGTRIIDNYIVVVEAIIASGWHGLITEVVCGDCEGVDQMGELWAHSRCIPVVHFPVSKEEWRIYGKRAGPIRNEAMAMYADALVLVWDGKSKGSSSMKKFAKRYKLKFYERIIDVRNADQNVAAQDHRSGQS